MFYFLGGSSVLFFLVVLYTRVTFPTGSCRFPNCKGPSLRSLSAWDPLPEDTSTKNAMARLRSNSLILHSVLFVQPLQVPMPPDRMRGSNMTELRLKQFPCSNTELQSGSGVQACNCMILPNFLASRMAFCTCGIGFFWASQRECPKTSLLVHGSLGRC